MLRGIANDRFECVLTSNMSLRDVYNKIIHATVVEPHQQEAAEAHEYDVMALESWQESHDAGSDAPPMEMIGWEHLSGFVRLAGRKGREQWSHLLCVPTFVEAIYVLLTEQDGTRWHVEALR